MNFTFRSGEARSASKGSPGRSAKQTSVGPALSPLKKYKTPVKPASILKETSTVTASSKKQALRELLGLLSQDDDVLWRSSPALFSSGKSSRKGSPSKTPLTLSPSCPETPTARTLSGITPLSPSDDGEDDEWDPFSSEEEDGGEDPPESPPLDNEAIYDMLQELEKCG
nr:MAG: ORF3 [Torque teno polar bear virus 36]